MNINPIEPNLSHGSVGIKVAQLAKDQQKLEGQIALQLIAAAAVPAPATPTAAPVGNLGHHVDIRV